MQGCHHSSLPLQRPVQGDAQARLQIPNSESSGPEDTLQRDLEALLSSLEAGAEVCKDMITYRDSLPKNQALGPLRKNLETFTEIIASHNALTQRHDSAKNVAGEWDRYLEDINSYVKESQDRLKTNSKQRIHSKNVTWTDLVTRANECAEVTDNLQRKVVRTIARFSPGTQTPRIPLGTTGPSRHGQPSSATPSGSSSRPLTIDNSLMCHNCGSYSVSQTATTDVNSAARWDMDVIDVRLDINDSVGKLLTASTKTTSSAGGHSANTETAAEIASKMERNAEERTRLLETLSTLSGNASDSQSGKSACHYCN